MSPTNVAAEQCTSPLRDSLPAEPFTENKHAIKCITSLAHTPDLLSCTNLNMELAFVPTSHSPPRLCRGLPICNMAQPSIRPSPASHVSDPASQWLTSHPIYVTSAAQSHKRAPLQPVTD